MAKMKIQPNEFECLVLIASKLFSDKSTDSFFYNKLSMPFDKEISAIYNSKSKQKKYNHLDKKIATYLFEKAFRQELKKSFNIDKKAPSIFQWNPKEKMAIIDPLISYLTKRTSFLERIITFFFRNRTLSDNKIKLTKSYIQEIMTRNFQSSIKTPHESLMDFLQLGRTKNSWLSQKKVNHFNLPKIEEGKEASEAPVEGKLFKKPTNSSFFAKVLRQNRRSHLADAFDESVQEGMQHKSVR